MMLTLRICNQALFCVHYPCLPVGRAAAVSLWEVRGVAGWEKHDHPGTKVGYDFLWSGNARTGFKFGFL